LPVRRDLRDQRAQRVRGGVLLEPARDRAVDPGREVVDGSVPADRDRPRPRDGLALVVEEMELKVGTLGYQTWPVDIEDVAVVVVLRKRVARQLPGALGDVRPLADRDRPH
jgi:hypothetical protein